MTVKLYFSFAADLVAVFLMICQMVRIKKLSGEKGSVGWYFRRFSCIVLVMAVLHLLNSYSDVQVGSLTWKDYAAMTESDIAAWIWTEMIAWFLAIFLSAVFLYTWITFLSWYLFEDRDFIRRRFWLGFIPLIISAVVSCVAIPMAVLSEQGYRFFIGAVVIYFFVRLYYFFISLWLLREYKKQNGYLRFFNPWAFFIPVFAGWQIQDLTEWGVASIGTTLGVMLLYSSIIGKQRYMDSETGFYNRDFAEYLKGLIARKKYAPLSAMIFTLDSPGKIKDFSQVLKIQLPKDCEPILRNDHEIVVLTNVGDRGPLNMVMEDVKAVSEVRTECTLKKKEETAEAFMERVL